MMADGYCNTESDTYPNSEQEHLTLSDLQSQGISLCSNDQYAQKDLIWQSETDNRGWAMDGGGAV